MSLKRWAVATVGAFVVFFVAGYAIHHVWLGGFYKANPGWWRPEADMQRLMPLMTIGQLLLAALLTVVYSRGYERGKGGLGQGLRFGVLMGLLFGVPNSLMHYVVYPYPMSLILNWFIGGLAEMTAAGTVIGALYKPET